MLRFDLTANGTTIRREVIAGATTFATMSYIIFVQPTVLGTVGMDPGAVMVATCVASAVATLLMGVLANYPIALAPAMGHTFYFAYGVCLGLGVPWRVALGANCLAGLAFVVLSAVGIRERIVEAIPASLQHAIGAVTAALFLLALFVSPLAQTISSGVAVGETRLYPVVAAPLILIGAFMLAGAGRVRWHEPGDALPAFLCMIMIPFTFSIADGIGFGILAHCLVRLAQRRASELQWLGVLSAVLFVLRYAVRG